MPSRLAPAGRVTNLVLLLALLLAFATGTGAIATGSARGRWIVIAHGVVGIGVILLVPWKSRVVRGGLRRARASRWVSLLLAALALAALGTGVLYATGLVRSVGGFEGMWWHVAFALALVPLVIWHVLARRVRPRRTDLSRRNLVRTGALAAAAGGLYLAVRSTVEIVGLPGARRRFTGSYETGSFDPVAMPVNIWLADPVPDIDPTRWRLTIVDGTRRSVLGLDELAGYGTTVRAALDCTSGWYSVQDWTGVPVSALVSGGGAGSLLVHSATGYWVRFPARDIDRLLLATRVGGAPLSAGHGFPLRLVAPHRRGYWWVKWVDRVEVQRTPWWWQPPFPVT